MVKKLDFFVKSYNNHLPPPLALSLVSKMAQSKNVSNIKENPGVQNEGQNCQKGPKIASKHE